ncbi:MAG: hypothetical protein CW742_03325 [Methanoregula sp.]|nr:MAG: hypothetical protein CW742_03325 [Methanoregula sp.]
MILIALLSVRMAAAAETVSVTNSVDAAAQVYISGYESSPAVFYPGESGTVTIHVTNAADTSVSVSQPALISPDFDIINSGSFHSVTNIGPGATTDYTFIVRADCKDGTYLPLFTVSPNTYGAKAINTQIKLRVDSTDIRASISAMPDSFAISKKDTVNVSISNPRSEGISNVLIVPETDGAEIFPKEVFVGTLDSKKSVQVPFSITPARGTNVTFHVTFHNGDNEHKTAVVLPVSIDKNKMGAEIVVNNIESTSSGMTTTLKGDVTNNGLTDAKSILVTVGDPARPVNPNPIYAVGNLEPDDFSSFEITYVAAGNKSVPLIVDYKDAEGNTFRETFSIAASDSMAIPGAGSLSSQSVTGSTMQRRGMFGSFGSGFGQIPVTEIVIILVAIALLVYAWRKGYLSSLRNRFRKDPLPGGKDEDDDEPVEK